MACGPAGLGRRRRADLGTPARLASGPSVHSVRVHVPCVPAGTHAGSGSGWWSWRDAGPRSPSWPLGDGILGLSLEGRGLRLRFACSVWIGVGG